MRNIGPFVKENIPASLVVTFTDADGEPLNLTGYTVKFVYWLVGATSGTERSVTLTDAEAGVVTYSWVEADFAAAGSYQGRAWAYIGSGTVRRFPSDLYAWIVADDPAVPAAFTA